MNRYSKRNQYGGANDDGSKLFVGSKYQRGYGLGSQFIRLKNWFMPIFRKSILPKLKSGVKEIAKESIKSVGNIANDVIEGENLQESSAKHINQSISNLKNAAEKEMQGLDNMQQGNGDEIKQNKKRKNLDSSKFKLIIKKRKRETDFFDY